MRTASSERSRGSIALFALFVAISLGIGVADVWHYREPGPQTSLFRLSNLVGPTAKNLLDGRGVSVCTEAMGTPGNPICFHAGRMPLATWMVALGVRLLGDDALRVNLLKMVMMLLPLEIAAWLVWLRLPQNGVRRVWALLILLAPFGVTVFLSDVRLMQVEEGYSYSMLALAVAILLFAARRGGLGVAAMLGVAVAGIYLAKSSMLPVVLVLVVGYWLLERRTAARAMVLMLAIAAPVGWAIEQHHVSGRYSVGTSMDGLNLHKGNNAQFLERYPPPAGDSLDEFDDELKAGQDFADEWSFNDFHRKAAVNYMKAHPRETLTADARKLWVALVSVHKIGSSAVSGVALDVEIAGLVVFRVLLWTSLAGAAWWVIRGVAREQRLAGGIFLTMVAACVLPYLAGFAYTRHVSVLIYPAALMCVRLVVCGQWSVVRGASEMGRPPHWG
ncbi:MAG: hypothetical protein M3O31_02345 [Acidobacteriota bacterium]|nr:hypothetical protein [Acidobacteriota bacterium]